LDCPKGGKNRYAVGGGESWSRTKVCISLVPLTSPITFWHGKGGGEITRNMKPKGGLPASKNNGKIVNKE